MAKYYLTIGYPLMVAATTMVNGYFVEISSDEVQEIPNDIALVWANLLSCDYSDNTSAIEKLAGRGLLIAGESKKELLNLCNDFYPYRQGIGSTFKENKKNENDKLFFSVMLGDKNYTLSEFQKLFWNKSNGQNTFSDVLKSIRNDGVFLNDEDMASQLFSLIKFGLLFIKK